VRTACLSVYRYARRHCASSRIQASKDAPRGYPAAMKLTGRVWINAHPSAVWPFVANPVLMSLWNPKIVSVDRASDEPVRLGERFEMIYTMSGKDRESSVEVVECEEPIRVVFRHHWKQDGQAGFADESYTLTQTNGGTRVEQVIDLGGTAIPWFLRGLIWIIATFGKPTGEPYMEKLKKAVEDNRAA
jgi:uncharacterized protein YndB with AHSA1/START domain